MTVSSGPLAQSLDCTKFQQIVERYLARPHGADTHLSAALAHLQGCHHCQTRWGRLLQAVLIDREDALTCTEAQAQLPEYVSVQLGGNMETERWRAQQVHLVLCPHCSRLFQELSQMVKDAAMSKFLARSAPAPDLSFLVQPPSRPSTLAQVKWRMDELGALLIEFSQVLLDNFSPPLAVGLKGDDTHKTLCRINLREVFDDLIVSIVALEAFQDPNHCELLIEVDVPSRGGWPNLAGIEVVIRRGTQLLESQRTDAFGKAVFTGIPAAELAELTVQVQPNV